MRATPRPSLAAIAVLALLCSSLALGPAPDPEPPPDDTVAHTATRPSIATGRAGADRPDAPVAPPVPALALDPVAVQQPRVRVDDVAPDAVGAALGVEGVSFATVIAVGEVAVAEPGGSRSALRVAMVDPAGFRVISPQNTADALDLWERLAADEAVFTHEHAQRLLLQLGTYVPLQDQSVRVGAIATPAIPPVADAIVNAATGARLGLAGASRSLLVALTAEARPERVARDLEAVLGRPATVIADPRAPQVVDGPAGGTVWDRLAVCESSGDWHINTGNGYYGGLQFLPESWYLAGGTGMPHEATRDEQIARAERLLAIQGWQAWPVCSILLGLRPGPLPERYRYLDPDQPAEPPPEPEPEPGPDPEQAPAAEDPPGDDPSPAGPPEPDEDDPLLPLS